jgi:hypothetical protein
MRVFGKKPENLPPEAIRFKKTYERWFYGVLVGFVLARIFGGYILPLSIIPLAFSFYCLYESQKNYTFYRAARDDGVKQHPYSER